MSPGDTPGGRPGRPRSPGAPWTSSTTSASGGAPEGHSSGKGRGDQCGRARSRLHVVDGVGLVEVLPHAGERALALPARSSTPASPRSPGAPGPAGGEGPTGASPRSAAGRRPPLRRVPSTPARRPASPPASASRAGAFPPPPSTGYSTTRPERAHFPGRSLVWQATHRPSGTPGAGPSSPRPAPDRSPASPCRARRRLHRAPHLAWPRCPGQG